MLIEQQIAARQERAASAVAKILERPAAGIYGDYEIKSASGKTYRVVEEIHQRLKSGDCRPCGLIATTFTVTALT